MRATVLGQTWMSRVASSVAIFSVVRRVQRIPVMGSPATSCCKAASMAAITSGVFFQGRPPAAGAAHAVTLHVPGEQLLASAGYGTGVETEQISDAAVTAMAELEGLKPGVQAALAFVEQRAEQDDGGSQLIRHAPACAERQASRLGLPDVPGAHLSASHRAVGREVDRVRRPWYAGCVLGGSGCATDP